ncbi:FLYWCH zinc finger domain-containing protein [Ditylenchus destructor]|uniref:FLYWCH zinc finger domain-containing protein n=1 Tax=Ditylenchus destructor TaxID=166010 RepID=A0AAD4MK84_9BILA|nr:FLYWCH zinc finger domain-containing protein [Ditylenchus destructor]
MDEESEASEISDVSYGAVSDDFFSDEEEEQMRAEISQEPIDNFVERPAENSREPSMEIVEQPRLVMTGKCKADKPRFKLIFQNYLYWKGKETKDKSKIIWRCVKKEVGCKGYLHTDNTNVKVVLGPTPHNHSGESMAPAQAILRHAIKRRALDTIETPGQILNQECGGIPVQLQMDFVVPDAYKTCNFAGNTELFLLADSGLDDTSRVLLFGRESHRELLLQLFKNSAHIKFLKQYTSS